LCGAERLGRDVSPHAMHNLHANDQIRVDSRPRKQLLKGLLTNCHGFDTLLSCKLHIG
jgi:hypothetical protein